jgi:hypothetical protein
MRKLNTHVTVAALLLRDFVVWSESGEECMRKNLVKGVKRVDLLQVIVNRAKINFKKCPVAPGQFDILNLRE